MFSSRSPLSHQSATTNGDPRQRQRVPDKLSRHEAARQAKQSARAVPAAVPPGSTSSAYHQRSMGPCMLAGSGSRMRRGKLSR